jgi:phenylacetate-CoA ligase
VASGVLKDLYDRLPPGVQQILAATAGWRGDRARFGSQFRSNLRELSRTDFQNADDVRIDQESRLAEMVRWAATTVPYYRNLFHREGIDPDSIRVLEDLNRIPFLDKETVRLRDSELLSEGFSRRILTAGHSSGTTGTALRLEHTGEALSWESAVIWRQRGWFGFLLGDRFAAFGGQPVVPFGQQKPPFWRSDLAPGRVLFSLDHMKPEFLSFYASELNQRGYLFWQGHPSSIALICEYLLENGIDLRTAAPGAVFTSSETLLDFHRERIISATHAPVADRYGNAELSVSAVQCPEGRYHVDTEFCALEIDPHEEGDDWVRGEVIATGFANRAMPLLRYRTGDIATLRKRAGCECGRSRPIIEELDGRIEDYVVTPDGRRVSRMDHVFKDALLVREAQILQSSPDAILVRIAPRPGYGPDAQLRIEREFHARLGPTIEIRFETVEAIPRQANGKFRAVISTLAGGRLRGVAEGSVSPSDAPSG